MEMVGPEGTRNRNETSAVDCQTGENRLIDAKGLFDRSSNREPPDSEKKSPDRPASTVRADLRNLGPAENTPEAEPSQAFDWAANRIIEEQPETAVYWNQRGSVSIRQWGGGSHEDDVIVTIDEVYLDRLIEKLCRMRDGVE